MHTAVIEMLVGRQLLSSDEGIRCLEEAAREGVSPETILLKKGTFDRTGLVRALENHYFCRAAEPVADALDLGLLAIYPRRLALRHEALPVGRDGDDVLVAFADPDDAHSVQAVGLALHKPVRKLVALRQELLDAIDAGYKRLDHEVSAPTAVKRPRPVAVPASSPTATPVPAVTNIRVADDQPVALVDRLLDEAIDRGASDLHVQPGEKHLLVRMRLDGILHTIFELSPDLAPSVTSRLKVLGGMDVADRRRPQDGRATRRRGDLMYDLRVSSLPSQFGEKIVVRLLAKGAHLLDLGRLQMPEAIRRSYQDVIDNPQGFFLVTGPTGCGKTTTLYATLNAIDRARVNVVTLEDPIEYSLPLITQMQVNEEIGVTFANGLRALMRQDPDVILVGEIRDAETVEIACRASLTGHKVFSTIHTNDASQAVTRLLNMGTQPYLIAATLRGVLSQRLVRTICPGCREQYEPTAGERDVLGHRPVEYLYRGSGCERCSRTGYSGRMAVYEYLRVTDAVQRLILDRASAFAIRHAAGRAGMLSLLESARLAVHQGLTSVSEVQRVVMSDESREQLCTGCQRTVSVDYTVCPFCQHVLKERCDGCGNAVETTWHACATCGKTIEREWARRHCPSCQAPVDTAATACPYCDVQLTEAA